MRISPAFSVRRERTWKCVSPARATRPRSSRTCLGYQPQHALTFLAVQNGKVACTGAQELSEGTDYRSVAKHLARVLTVNDLTAVVLVGYGPNPSTQDALEQAIDVFTAAGITILDAMRVGENQVWHVGCDEPECQNHGLPYDPQSSVAAASATYVGLQVAADRQALIARLAPVTGADRDAMLAAVAATWGTFDFPMEPAETADLLEALVAEALAHRLPDERAARLLVLLAFPQVRDYACHLVHGTDAQIQAWTDLTRRAGSGQLACTPAMFLAMAALQSGDGVTATLAADRACAADPDDELARMLEQAIQLGLSPQALKDALHN